MKKLLCFLLCLTLIFSSVNLSFAAVSDSQAASIVSDLSTVKTTLNNIYTRLGTIMGYLVEGGHGVAYWVQAIDTWMQPIYASLTSNLTENLNLEPIIAGLNEVVSDGTNTSYFPYLKYGGKSNANWLSDLYTTLSIRNNTYLWTPTSTGGTSLTQVLYNNPLQAIPNQLNTIGQSITQTYSYDFAHRDNGYNTSQTALNWTDIDSQYTFTPTSVTNGIYSWFSSIQAPVARLSYVLASDERIEAQEAAAANEEAVVDNFIDSNGDGAASPSDIGSVSGLSSGYKQNFATDASPSGIFDIFNSDHATWFSQETKNQLDTTTPSRLSKGSASETPLLDKQIKDIYDTLGVKQP